MTRKAESRAAGPAGKAGAGASWRLVLLACAAVFAVGAAARVAGSFNDLWLDEIWSVRFIRDISSPADILFKIHHDNNHYLNSFFAYLVGVQRHSVLYRSPSLLAGLGTVVLAGLIARRWGRLAVFTAVFLTGWSYVLIHYSSEARGYSPAVFFALLSFLLLERYMAKPTWAAAGLFGLSAVLGFLSHLTFVYFYLAAVAWSARRLVRRRGRRAAAELARCHLLPLGFLAFLYLVNIRKMILGSREEFSFFAVAAKSLAMAVGLPGWGIPAVIASCGVAVLLGWAVLRLWRRDDDLWIFLAAVIVLAPAAVMTVMPPHALYVRYLLVCLIFVLVALAYVLPQLWRRHPAGKVLYVGVLLAAAAGNAWHMAVFLQRGRGQYRDAIAFVVGETQARLVTISGDRDYRMTLGYYQIVDRPAKRIVFFRFDSWPPEGPEWLIWNAVKQPHAPPQVLRVQGRRFHFVRGFRRSFLSGLDWFIYHNALAAEGR